MTDLTTCPDCGLLLCPQGSLWDATKHCARSWIFEGEVQSGNVHSQLDCAKVALARLRSRVAELEREVTAWRALAELPRARYDVAFPGRRALGDFGGSVADRTERVVDELGMHSTPRIYGEGPTPQAAAIDLAAKLDLLPKESP